MGYLLPTFRNYSSPSSSSVQQLWESSVIDDEVALLNNLEALMHSKYLFAKCMCAEL
jgi:hypothetical protein